MPRIVRLTAESEPDFWSLHCPAGEAGWCCCVAWHVDSFDGWDARTAEQNRALREAVFARGEHDGYLLIENDGRDDGRTVGWCQVAPRDRLPNLVRRHRLPPDPGALAIGCFVVVPSRRREGLASRLLAGVLEDLRTRHHGRVEAFPKRGASEPGEMWTGPEAMFLAAGFQVERDDQELPVLVLNL
jgi:GNAT superfamily N-acetyltransferase